MGRHRTIVITLFAVAGLLLAVTPASAAEPRVSGTVTDADGDPIAGICVTVHDASSRFAVAGQDTTDQSGDYTVVLGDGYGAGEYKVQFTDCTDTRSQLKRYAFEWYEDSGEFEDATVLQLDAAEHETGVAEDLSRGGEISGTVTGPAGDANICVLVINPRDYSFAAQVTTSSSGAYTAGGLRSQDYLVKFSDCGDTRQGTDKYAFEFYDDVITIDGADPVSVDAPATTEDIDAQLVRSGAISGHVSVAAGGADLEGACVDVVHQGYHSVAGAITDSDGNYTVLGLPPGQDAYKVAFYDCDEADPELGFEWFNEEASVAMADPVDVASGSPTGNVDGTLGAGGSLSGTVTADGGDDGLDDVCVLAHSEGVPDRPVMGGRTGADGGYTIDHLRAGDRYEVEYVDCQREARDHRLEYREGDGDGDGESLLFQTGDLVTAAAGGTPNVDESLGGIVDRIYGERRVQTAAALSRNAFESQASPAPASTDTVVVARSDEYPDALAGAPLAHALDAPILLTQSDSLNPDTAAEINRLGATRAVLLGGVHALSENVAEEIEAQTTADDVDRVWGATRFGTAQDIAAHPALSDASHAYVVEGVNPLESRGWPDAISGGALASHLRRPILLTRHDLLPEETRQALQDLDGSGDATIIGGIVAVDAGVEDEIDGIVDVVDRIFGADRYETSVEVAKVAEDARSVDGTELSNNRMWLATGSNWPDALAGGPTVARDLGNLLIVPKGSLEDHTRAYLSDNTDEIHRVEILGGVVAISAQTETDVRAAIDAGAAFSAQSADGGSAAMPFLFPGTDAWRTVIAGG